MSRRVRVAILLAVLVGAVVLVAALLASRDHRSTDGPLGPMPRPEGNCVAAPDGSALFWTGGLSNLGTEIARLETVQLDGSSGLQLQDAVVTPPVGTMSVGDQTIVASVVGAGPLEGSDLAEAWSQRRPVEGTFVEPGTTVSLALVLRTDGEPPYRATGFELLYRSQDGERYRWSAPTELSVATGDTGC